MRFLLLFSPWLISIFTIFANPSSSVSPCAAEHQISLLLRLKADLLYDASLSRKLAKWNNQTRDFCVWPGVGCFDNCVVELDLSNENIYDGLNSSSALFDFKQLERLNLAFNSFSNSNGVLARLGDLERLTYLNLSNAGFTGQIPVEILSLRGLESLDFSTFSYLGTPSLKLEKPGLGDLVRNLSRLSILYLDGVDLLSSGTTWSSALSLSLPYLRELSVPYCNLLAPVDDLSLGKLQFLAVLRLDGNNLSSLDPRVFARFSHLESLSAVSCELKGNFPVEVFQLPTLQTLDLSDNQDLHGNIPQFFGNNSLQTLTLSNTKFTGTIPESVGELKMLSHLNLGQCSFHGPIPRQLWNLTNLVTVDLSNNLLNGSVQSFAQLANLTSLLLPSNLLTGSIAGKIWKELVLLENLDLRNNSLSGSIPASLFSMPSMKKLLLSHNRFDHLENPDWSLIFSSVVDTLDLGSNKLQGPFPTFVFRLPDIKILTMCFNNFSGALNLSLIHNLRNLSSLDLSFNNLSIEATEVGFSPFPQLSTLKLASSSLKKIPDFMKNQSRLIYIDLSDNQIYGKIPKWVMGMSTLSHLNLSYNSFTDFEDRNLIASLNTLDLRSNHLKGELPSLPLSASYMDFSMNSFSSKLPSEIGTYLSYTIFFSLGNNFFGGNIPTSICGSPYLQVLDLSNNRFEGEFPKCLVNMSQTLGVLNLRNNNITGSISDSFVANCTLKTFDLNGNSIHGKLPKSLSNCKQLEVLNLGNNRIDDRFPCWLKKVPTLRVLVLRSNMFHGSIGCPDITRTWKMLQIVDVACNKFIGSLDSDCLSSWVGMMINTSFAASTHSHIKFKVLELGQLYYQDTVKVTFKGQQVELVKILTVFSSIDFSSNQLSGKIPDMIGNFTSLFVLNFSYNLFNSHIPASLGNLAQLESLDLSNNQLTGEIPNQLANLTFLSVLNLSNNRLEGKIPSGRQFNTFSISSYLGNEALCGAPLSNLIKCKPPEERKEKTSNSGSFDWRFILTGVGFGVGSGTVVAPLMVWEKGKTWHDKQVDMLLSHILHLLGLSHFIQNDVLDEKDERGESENDSDDEVAVDEAQETFCLFCSKIDITRKKVIHNPKCRCHESPPTSFESSSSSSMSFVRH